MSIAEKRESLNGNADFRNKLIRIVGDAVIDQRNFAGEAADGQRMCPNIGHQPGALFGRFGMAASKANGYTRSFRQRKGFAQKTVFRLQRQENAIVTIITPGVEVFGGDTHPELARVYLKKEETTARADFLSVQGGKSKV